MTNTECKCITDKQSEKNFVYKGTIVVRNTNRTNGSVTSYVYIDDFPLRLIEQKRKFFVVDHVRISQ